MVLTRVLDVAPQDGKLFNSLATSIFWLLMVTDGIDKGFESSHFYFSF